MVVHAKHAGVGAGEAVVRWGWLIPGVVVPGMLLLLEGPSNQVGVQRAKVATEVSARVEGHVRLLKVVDKMAARTIRAQARRVVSTTQLRLVLGVPLQQPQLLPTVRKLQGRRQAIVSGGRGG